MRGIDGISEARVTYEQIAEYLRSRLEMAVRRMAMAKGHDDMLRHQGACQVLYELQNLPAAIKTLATAAKEAEKLEREQAKRAKPWRGF